MRPISSSTPGSDRREEPLDVLAVEVGAALGDGAQRCAPRVEPAREGRGPRRAPPRAGCPRRVGTRRGRGPSARLERVAERMGGIGGDERARARPRSAARTAAAAAHVVLPTPPLPPKKRKSGAGARRRGLSGGAVLRARGSASPACPRAPRPRRWPRRPAIFISPGGGAGARVALADLADPRPAGPLSISANSSSVISPSSSRICAASSSSRRTVSSFSSASTAWRRACRGHEAQTPPMSSDVSDAIERSIAALTYVTPLSRALQLQPDVDEVVGRPGARVLEGQLVVPGADLLHLRVEGRLLLARHQEGGVHDHLVADGLVGAGGHRHRPQLLEDLAHVALGARLQRGVHEPAVLHAREVGRALLRGDLALEPPDVLVLALDLADDDVAVPQHLEAELELVLHLVEHVVEGLVGRAQQLDDVVPGLEHGAERHGDDGVLAHDRLVHALVGEDVLARGVEDLDRRVGDDGGDVLVVDGVDVGRLGADADGPELQGLVRADDAVDVLAAARPGRAAPRRGAAAARAGRRRAGRGALRSAPAPAPRGLGRGRRPGRAAAAARAGLSAALPAFLPSRCGSWPPSSTFSAPAPDLAARTRRISASRSAGQARLGEEGVAAGLARALRWPARAWPVRATTGIWLRAAGPS